jgi:transketolase
MNKAILAEWQRLNEEIKRVQEMIQTLEARKQTVAQIYASSSEMLGLEADLDVSPAIKDAGEDSAEALGVGEIDL